MIGVIAKPTQQEVVEEFFQLFKTPWEFYRPGQAYDVVIATAEEIPEVKTGLLLLYGATAKNVDRNLGVVCGQVWEGGELSSADTSFPTYAKTLTFEPVAAGVPCVMRGSLPAGFRIEKPDSITFRLGYDLFEETAFLLTNGQPVKNAEIPTLDLHIERLRAWIVETGIPFVEIPPSPAGYSFSVCPTHDIDFVGIRRHIFDHSMFGFVYRATVGTFANVLKGRLAVWQMLKAWLAVLSLPLVYVGWAEDFWEPFAWYLKVEAKLASTYFLIPFKRRPGEKVPGSYPSRRGTAYGVHDISESVKTLLDHGCEIGVHGIDAWHSREKGREELKQVASVVGDSATGIRMHWLLRDEHTPVLLEDAGYAYDSTFGYNETVGYRAGTSQVFRPLGAHSLLELPMHIQDGALFFPQRLNLTEEEAENRCQGLIDNASRTGGVLTLLWHDRSHGPERYWGEFYVRLLAKLKAMNCWFSTASELVGWFRKRREVRFEMLSTSGMEPRLHYEGSEIKPPLSIRIYNVDCYSEGPRLTRERHLDISWSGRLIEPVEAGLATILSRLLPDSRMLNKS